MPVVSPIVCTGSSGCARVGALRQNWSPSPFNDGVQTVGAASDILQNSTPSPLLLSFSLFPSVALSAQIVQYIRLVREDYAGSSEQSGVTWYDELGFGLDMEAGHGTHTAGTAAGSTLAAPAETVTCEAGSEVSCVGKCLTSAEAAEAATDNLLTWDTLCPQYDCDGGGGACLSEDVSETLTANGGIARGAKIAVFDVSIDGNAVWASLAENGLWDATEGTGCMLHSNSWGGDLDCNIDTETTAFDQYMYEVGVSTLWVDLTQPNLERPAPYPSFPFERRARLRM